MQIKNDKYSSVYCGIKIIFAISIFLLTFYLSCKLDMDKCPDEYMRYSIPQWILANNSLPHGDEPELINPIWGFSYGYTVYLPSLFSVFFMKIVSVFSSDPKALLIAARFVSVISITLLWFVCCAIGEKIFHSKVNCILFAVLCCFLPQFLFLSSYLNNDSFGVLCCALIVYFWISGDKNKWTYKTCIAFGISTGMLALTYYNDYGFLLCSLIIYSISCFKNKISLIEFLKKGLIIFASAFVICGWFFVRNFIIHDGDFLGMKSMYACGEVYAQEPFKPSKRLTLANSGISFQEAFCKKESIYGTENWFVSTFKSFVGVFGYMQFQLSPKMYSAYILLFFIMNSCFLICLFTDYRYTALKVNLLLCTIIPIGLSMYYTYYIDYQAQGRYVMSILIPFMFFNVYGIDCIEEKKLHKTENYISGSIIILYLMLSAKAVFMVLIPNCISG